MSTNPGILLGYPIELSKICKIYPPTLNEVLLTAEYSTYESIFLVSQEDIWDSLAERDGEIPDNAPTPFQKLMVKSAASEEYLGLVERAIKFFTHEEVIVQPDGDLIFFLEGFEDIKEVGQLRYLSEESYFYFQNGIRIVTGNEIVEPPVIDESPKARQIKAKLRKRKKLVDEHKKGEKISLSTMLVALSCMNVGFSLLKESGEISYPAIPLLFKMGQEKERHQTDMLLIAGGADAKKIKPKTWIRETEK